MQLPSLETIGGDLNARGAKELLLPKLRSVGGHFRVDGTGLKRLPPNLEHIGGNAYISANEPKSLLQDLIAAKQSGSLKGELFVDEKPYDGAGKKPSWKFW